MAPGTDLELRAMVPADRGAVLALLSASLGWDRDERFEAFFEWKHEHNPFGTSPAWVALDDGEVVGFRTFLRWELDAPDGSRLRAARAVDTATHPGHQGRGIFRRLTLQALEDLGADGLDLVFNTPNAKSRPGYLKMGWTEVGRLPASVHVSGPTALLRIARSRVPAERWSVPTSAGRPAPEVLADAGAAVLADQSRPPGGLRTRRSAEHLRWRYGFGPLEYRAVTLSPQAEDGFAVFRLRRRGDALECALLDVVVPAGEGEAARRLTRAVAEVSEADYVIRIGGPVLDRGGFVRLPGQGPVLTHRALLPGVPGAHLDEWQLSLGDIELF